MVPQGCSIKTNTDNMAENYGSDEVVSVFSESCNMAVHRLILTMTNGSITPGAGLGGGPPLTAPNRIEVEFRDVASTDLFSITIRSNDDIAKFAGDGLVIYNVTTGNDILIATFDFHKMFGGPLIVDRGLGGQMVIIFRGDFTGLDSLSYGVVSTECSLPGNPLMGARA